MIDYRRHTNVFNPKKFALPVHIVGCGGMGSRIAEGLIRMGVGQPDQSPITLYDHDAFEPHNLTNQWVTIKHLYTKKVRAVRKQMRAINPEAEINIVSELVKESDGLSGVVFLCLDSMQARRDILDDLDEFAESIHCIIETRMDANVGISHCFNPNSENQFACWRMYWHSDREAENMAGCGGPQSIISAIYGTTAIALKQFEHFAREGFSDTMPNRVYYDMVECEVHNERWPPCLTI